MEKSFSSLFFMVIVFHLLFLFFLWYTPSSPSVLPDSTPLIVQTIALQESKPKPPVPPSTPHKERPFPPKKEKAIEKREPAPQKKPLREESPTKPIQKKKSAKEALQKAKKQLPASSSSQAIATSSNEDLSTPTLSSSLSSHSSEEKNYRSLIAEQMRLFLRLPEEEEVRLTITLSREGTIHNIDILSSKSPLNRQKITDKLHTLHFPPFDNLFPDEEVHTFSICLY